MMMPFEEQTISLLRPTAYSTQSRGGGIDPNIHSIDTNAGIGIGSILAR